MTDQKSGKLRVFLLILAVLSIGAAWVALRTPASPFDGAPTPPPSAELLQRGEYVARQADCVACHSTPKSKPFAGGLEMATPLGAIYATNITPDRGSGIGDYSLAEFDRALRHGVARDGHRLYPAMPYPSYAKMSDEDVSALYAYFMHGVKPVAQANQDSEIAWPLNMRWPLAFWNLAFTSPHPYQPDPTQDALWNRGAYLVQGAGHCGSCHTPRGMAMNEKGLDGGHPLYLSGALLDGWYAPSLRGDVNTGIGRWSEAEVVQFLKTGRNQHAVVFGSMADAFNNSTQFMSEQDLQAIARYLKSLPGDPQRDGDPWKYDAGTTTALAAQRLDSPGARTYMAKCAACHAVDGRGRAPWIPPLAGAVSALAKEDASAINVTLNGSMRVVADGVPDSYRMPPLRSQLSDAEIADVLSFIRSSWGNHGGAVKVEDVRTLRDRTNPASSNPIVLQMR